MSGCRKVMENIGDFRFMNNLSFQDLCFLRVFLNYQKWLDLFLQDVSRYANSQVL